MSWQSSALYYRLINEETARRLGGYHNTRSLMSTIDFADVERLQHEGRWKELGAMLANAAKRLEHGGADFLLLCTNTMHKEAEAIERAVRIPFLHIVDATAAVIRTAGQKRVGLLGTRFTMEEPFYSSRLQDKFEIETVVPSATSRQLIHEVIYRELCRGVILQESREQFQGIIRELAAAGAEAIILGCTEIELLISQADSHLPAYASTSIHTGWSRAPGERVFEGYAIVAANARAA